MTQHVPVENLFVPCLTLNQRPEGETTMWESEVRGWKEEVRGPVLVLAIQESRGSLQEAGAWTEWEESTGKYQTKEELTAAGGMPEMALASSGVCSLSGVEVPLRVGAVEARQKESAVAPLVQSGLRLKALAG